MVEMAGCTLIMCFLSYYVVTLFAYRTKSTTLKHISTSKQCQRFLFAVYNKYNVKNLEYKNHYVPGMEK